MSPLLSLSIVLVRHDISNHLIVLNCLELVLNNEEMVFQSHHMSVYALFYYMVLFPCLNILLYLKVSPFVRALEIKNKAIVTCKYIIRG